MTLSKQLLHHIVSLVHLIMFDHLARSLPPQLLSTVRSVVEDFKAEDRILSHFRMLGLEPPPCLPAEKADVYLKFLSLQYPDADVLIRLSARLCLLASIAPCNNRPDEGCALVLEEIERVAVELMPESEVRKWISQLRFMTTEQILKEMYGMVDKFYSREQITVLFLAADPTDRSRLRLGEEFREIDQQLTLGKQREQFNLALPRLALRPEDITRALLDVLPQIVHFSGHGTPEGALCFEDKSGKAHFVQPDALAALFEQFAHQVRCVLLNACYSETQAKAIGKHIRYVIGMNQAIGDKAAIAFAIGFYQALGAGRTIEDAYKLGCVQIRLQGIPEHLTPVLIKEGQLQS